MHFRDLDHKQKLCYLEKLAKKDAVVMSILVDKTALQTLGRFSRKQLLYFYIIRYLLERISWYCHDNPIPKTPDGGSIKLCFSNRGGVQYSDLIDYLLILQTKETSINWTVIRPDEKHISTLTSGKSMGLQVADAIAHSVWRAVEPRYLEPTYISMLQPITYHRYGRYIRYGLKFWPGDAKDYLSTDDFDWLRWYFI